MGESLFQILAGLGAGLAGGLLSGAFGIGGGIVLVPLLALALHLDQHRAQGVTLAAMLLPNSLPAVLQYRRQGIPIHWRLVGWMTAGFLPGLVAGAWGANQVPARPLRLFFAAFLVLLALRTLGRRVPDAGTAASRPAFPLAGALGIGFLGGLSAGLLGIGGGVVLIPLMVGAWGLAQREAQLQSLVLLLPPLGLPGVWVYARAQGGLPGWLLGGVAAGFALGAYLGARGTARLSGPWLSRAFAGLMLLTAALMVAKG